MKAKVICHHCGREAVTKIDTANVAYRLDRNGKPVCGSCEKKKPVWVGRLVFTEANKL